MEEEEWPKTRSPRRANNEPARVVALLRAARLPRQRANDGNCESLRCRPAALLDTKPFSCAAARHRARLPRSRARGQRPRAGPDPGLAPGLSHAPCCRAAAGHVALSEANWCLLWEGATGCLAGRVEDAASEQRILVRGVTMPCGVARVIWGTWCRATCCLSTGAVRGDGACSPARTCCQSAQHAVAGHARLRGHARTRGRD